MLKFKCHDVGFDCGFVPKARQKRISYQCAAHATKDHGMKQEDITQELKDKIKSSIHKSLF